MLMKILYIYNSNDSPDVLDSQLPVSEAALTAQDIQIFKLYQKYFEIVLFQS